MKILQLCKKFPYPLKDGESIAVSYLATALTSLDCEITLLVMNTVKHFFDLDKLPASYNHYKAIHQVAIDNRLKISGAFLNLFSSQSYHVSRYDSAEYRQKLTKLLQTEVFDIVQLETLYLAPYIDTIRKHSNAKIVLRSHNVEFEIWERITSNTAFGPKKWYLSLLSKRLRNFEIACLNRYDLIAAITERDWRRFVQLGCTIPGHICPIGLKMENYPELPQAKGNLAVGFIGSMDWMPNLEGVRWFLEKVWPTFIKKHPKATFNIAGRNTPDWIRDLALPGLVVKGEVDSALAFMEEQNIMIVPLFSGSGMRVKILESMALARATVTTTLGVEGISATHRENILIADTATEFVEQLEWCIQNEAAAKELSQKARLFIIENYDNRQIASKLFETYDKIKQSA